MSDATTFVLEDDPFAQLGRIVLGDEPLDQILLRVVHLANQVLDASTEASITLLAGETPSTVACTGEPALSLDERQYAAERGPCLDAAAAGERILVTDLTTDTRWPQYAKAAVDHGVHSSLSIPLPVQRHVIGAINFYSASPDAFDDRSIELAETFAAHAAVAVANAHLYEATAALAEQMQHAMTSRAAIEQAKGIIMRDRGCSADEAFEALVRLSQESHVKLRDVAHRLVDQVARDS